MGTYIRSLFLYYSVWLKLTIFYFYFLRACSFHFGKATDIKDNFRGTYIYYVDWDISGRQPQPFDPRVDPKSYDFSRILPFSNSKVTESKISNCSWGSFYPRKLTNGETSLSNENSAITNHILELGRLISSGSFIDIQSNWSVYQSRVGWCTCRGKYFSCTRKGRIEFTFKISCWTLWRVFLNLRNQKLEFDVY